MSINDDILLLKLIQSGNEQAFKYLFDTYFASLCRFAHVYVSDTQDAEELILELFVHIWEQILLFRLKHTFFRQPATGA